MDIDGSSNITTSHYINHHINEYEFNYQSKIDYDNFVNYMYKIISNNDIESLQNIDSDILIGNELKFLDDCIVHNKFDLYQWYIEKYQVETISKFTVARLFLFRRYDMIKFSVDKKLFLSVDLECFNIESIEQILEYIHNTNICEIEDPINFIYVACRSGKIEYVYEIFMKYNMKFTINHKCINRANLQSLEWFYSMYKKNLLNLEYDEMALQNAFRANDVSRLKWWVEHSDEFELKYGFEYFEWFSLSLETIKYIFEEQDVIMLKIPDNIMELLFYESNKTKLDYWYDLLLRKNIEPFPKSLNFAKITDIKVLDWIYHKYQLGLLKMHFEFDLNTFLYTIRNESIQTLRWWFNHADEFNIKESFILNDQNYDYYLNLKMSNKTVKYLYFEQKIITMKLYPLIIDCICEQGDLNSLNLFYNNKDLYPDSGFVYTSDAIDLSQNIDIYEWFYQKSNELEFKYTEKCIDTLCMANIDYIDIGDNAKNNCVSKELKWWFDHRFDLEIKFTEDILRYYISKNSNRDYLSVLLS
jgi:hypothetical protein